MNPDSSHAQYRRRVVQLGRWLACILDRWRHLDARADPLERRYWPMHVPRYREIPLEESWAVLCELCGQGAFPHDAPHLRCVAYEAMLADLAPGQPLAGALA